MNAYDTIIGLLQEHGIDHRIIDDAPAGTVEEAAAAGFDIHTMLKTVVFRAKGEPARYFLCALRAMDAVDYKKLAAATGIRRDDLIRPAADEVERELGFEAGAVGPFVVTPAVQVLFDDATTQVLDWVHCGCGRRDRTLEAHLTDLVRISSSIVVPLAK